MKLSQQLVEYAEWWCTPTSDTLDDTLWSYEASQFIAENYDREFYTRDNETVVLVCLLLAELQKDIEREQQLVDAKREVAKNPAFAAPYGLRDGWGR